MINHQNIVKYIPFAVIVFHHSVYCCVSTPASQAGSGLFHQSLAAQRAALGLFLFLRATWLKLFLYTSPVSKLHPNGMSGIKFVSFNFGEVLKQNILVSSTSNEILNKNQLLCLVFTAIFSLGIPVTSVNQNACTKMGAL